MTGTHLPIDVFERHLANQPEAQDGPLIERWGASNPLGAEATKRIRQAVVEESLSQAEQEAMWQRVQAVDHIKLPTPRRRRQSNRLFPQGLGLAAMASVILGVASVLYIGAKEKRAVEETIVSAGATRDSVVLADGSRIVLAPHTQLRVTHGNATRATTVSVQGEAQFIVSHSQTKPFTVRTENTTVHVLGTSFIVRQRPHERATRVLVTEGRVSVVPAEASRLLQTGVVLDAQMLAEVSDSGSIQVVRGVDPERYSTLVSGRLVFRQVVVREIIAELSKSYGVAIQLPDSGLASRKLTFTADPERNPIDVVMSALARALDAQVVQQDSVLTLVPGRSTLGPARRSPHFVKETGYGR